MNKEILSQLLPWVIIVGAVLLIGWGASYLLDPFKQTSADVAQEDAAAIAKYKDWIRDIDLPFVGGKIKAADLPLAVRKVIDHDVQAGDLKSARHFIRLAMDRKIDDQVLALTETPATKELIVNMQNAQQKVAALQQFIALLDRPATGKEERDKTDAELTQLADRFVPLPFNPVACPESAAEIAGLYRGKLTAQKDRSPAVKRVVEEIEKKCLPESKKE